MAPSITAVILAAGKGTRMKSNKAKVLHEVFFKPMVHHVLDAVSNSQTKDTVLIIGHQKDAVLDTLEAYDCLTVEQKEQLGTGHAVLCSEKMCKNTDHVLILCGDTPLIESATLNTLIDQHLDSKATITLMTTRLENPFGYGRIVQNEQEAVTAIVEQKDASPEQLQINEINAGIYLVRRSFLFEALKQVGTDNSQGEVYLTDIVSIAVNSGQRVERFVHPHPVDVLGVNSRVELAQANTELQMRHNRNLMLAGVTMLAPETIQIEPNCSIGVDCVLEAGVSITGSSRIGKGCVIRRGAVIHRCTIDDEAVIGPNAVLENCSIGSCEHIPPLVHRVG
ncbi:bifunctional UDP-N-acetylglucosamine diphosphorylase/glucosamine-1-phosphate N-acetyltransferase GlmU [Desulfogranum japonicum]|uniref:bifunctional UDP-N-acetylglucosamine diphosphorylase/glucosamine-1-phosphate N-acetyltransferase GlmU n=1 Tax=Desulfogranum japonicum TaxID=231447 RepID=UPI00040F9E5E|nr:sugar phosphate nucleotidyltransferase [Desulfogranum japonicum]